MDKRKLHHLWTLIRPIKVWYIAALLLVSAGICVMALRDNNLVMVQLRDDVYAADRDGKDVEGALQKLRAHVYGHMNTELSTGNNVYPPIQLKYTYQRLQQAEKDRVKQDNAKIYTDAQSHCEKQNPSGFSGRGRVPCIEEYVSSHGVKETTIPDAMYKFDFVSPSWSPDLAGFSLIASALFLLLLVVRIAAGRILKSLTK
jgi:hypothetical protein